MRTRREQAVVYSIVNEPYEPVTAIRVGVPLELDRILSKALAKKPEERYPAQRRGARRSEALTVGAKIGPTPLRSVRAGQGSGSKLVEIRRCQRIGSDCLGVGLGIPAVKPRYRNSIRERYIHAAHKPTGARTLPKSLARRQILSLRKPGFG